MAKAESGPNISGLQHGSQTSGPIASSGPSHHPVYSSPNRMSASILKPYAFLTMCGVCFYILQFLKFTNVIFPMVALKLCEAILVALAIKQFEYLISTIYLNRLCIKLYTSCSTLQPTSSSLLIKLCFATQTKQQSLKYCQHLASAVVVYNDFGPDAQRAW